MTVGIEIRLGTFARRELVAAAQARQRDLVHSDHSSPKTPAALACLDLR
jgi:hypothetical protein